MRTQITDRTIGTAFRAGWRGDYPSMLEFLERCCQNGARLQRRRLLNREFDGCGDRGAGRADAPESQTLTNTAQILLQDAYRWCRCGTTSAPRASATVDNGDDVERIAGLREHRQSPTMSGS